MQIYIIAYVKIQKNEDILSIMSNLQPNSCLKIDFQKVQQHAGRQVVNPRHQTSQGQSVAKLQVYMENSSDQWFDTHHLAGHIRCRVRI